MPASGLKLGQSFVVDNRPGVGNTLHLAGALFNARAGTKMVHVPYKGAGPAISALIGGEVQMMSVTTPLGLAQIKAGKLRPLAYNNPTRGVPARRSDDGRSGVVRNGMELNASWYGLFVPAKTSGEIVAKLMSEIQKALANPQVRERYAALGLEPVGSTPAQFRPFVAASIERFAELVRLAGVEPE